ncbi:hypothetical protein [Colwellia sp. E2M01]|uniref:hypothetical protein n=1 Tax=Colwellia sp. E2M01 TaxID=2841561 RepID=UPI001C090F38|nr:hypothetical protein [Colwellia sp. E2M01]MBU2869359.1 hypothetical protein [Colwellia sp. E2M01]
MIGQDLLLRQGSLFCLPFEKEEEGSKEHKDDLITRVRFSCSLTYVARNSYWEGIVQYPTTNLVEVYKIVKSEIGNISPVSGHTFAYIINSSKKQTTVLYCCFSEEVIASAESLNLWRLLPESLVYYRHFYGKSGVYLANLNLLPVNHIIKEQNRSDNKLTQSSDILIKIDGDTCSSLPVDQTKADMFTAAMIDDAQIIEKSEIETVFNKFNLLKAIDFAVQCILFIINFFNEKGHLARYFSIAIVTFIFTFMLGKSAVLNWHNNYLTDKVADAKNVAAQALKVTNELNSIKSDIDKIDAVLALQLSKQKVLRLLASLVTEDNALVFSTIDITPGEIQLRGTVKNSANLLTALSKVNGFTEVEFNAPPASLKDAQERFFIKLRFDNNINKAKLKSESNE